MNSIVVASILIYLFMILALASVYAARVKRVPPNIALIITGRMTVDPETGEAHHDRIVTGGGRLSGRLLNGSMRFPWLP